MTSIIKDKILAWIDKHSADQLHFVIDLCSQNSFTYNTAGSNKISKMILEELNPIFKIHEVISQSEVGDHHILRTTRSSHAIVLIGHVDTVFPPDHPFKKCTKKGDWLIGPGAGDMKGGLAVMVYSLKALKDLDLIHKLNIAVIFNSDEEIGSVTSQKIFEKERTRVRMCIGGECSGLNGELVVSRNGKAGAKLTCTGENRHVGTGTHEKASAILEMAHKILDIESLNAYLPGVSLNIGKIEGGQGPSTVPGKATALFDLRWKDEEHYQVLLNQLQKVISRSHRPKCHSEITILNSRPAMPASSKNIRLFNRINKIAKTLNMTLNMEHRRGTSDVNYFGSASVPTLDGFGPVCMHDHTSKEKIRISTLKSRTYLLTLFLANCIN